MNLIIFDLQGNLTLNTKQDILEIIKRNVKAETESIALDMGRVGFVDSAGLALLIQLCKFTMGLGIRLCLCSISEQMSQLLQLTSTASLFEIFDSRESFYQAWVDEFPSEATVKPLETVPTIGVITD